MVISPQGLHEERLVAVAIDKNKGSQYALRWAAENILAKGHKVTLLHVPQSSSSPPSPTSLGGNDQSIGQDSNNQSTDLFLPFRVFCALKEVAYDLITLEGHDIAKALIEYVSLYRVQNLVLGCPSKNGISRLFAKSDVANMVMKKAPSFCNIYIVSKGKISASRMASHPLKKREPVPTLQIPPRNSNFDAMNFMSPFSRLSTSGNKSPSDDVPKADNSYSGLDHNRMSTDSVFLDCYDNLGSFEQVQYPNRRPSKFVTLIDPKSGDQQAAMSFMGTKGPGFSPTRLVDFLDSPNHDLLVSKEKGDEDEENSLSSDKIKELEEKMRRLELQTIQTMEMYHAACKEALREKQKLKELEILRKEEEKKVEEAIRQKEEALASLVKERALRMASKEEVKAAQRKAEREAQRRKRLERKAQRKSEAKKTELKNLIHSQNATKYQSLLRILVVVIIFYVYFFEWK